MLTQQKQRTVKAKMKLNMNMPESLANFLKEESEKLQVSPAVYLEHLLWFDWEIKKQASIIRGRNRGPCEVTA